MQKQCTIICYTSGVASVLWHNLRCPLSLFLSSSQALNELYEKRSLKKFSQFLRGATYHSTSVAARKKGLPQEFALRIFSFKYRSHFSFIYDYLWYLGEASRLGYKKRLPRKFLKLRSTAENSVKWNTRILGSRNGWWISVESRQTAMEYLKEIQ